jgi:predicted transposase YdaD
MWYETEADPQRSFLALVLFLDPALDPGEPPMEPRAPSRLLKLYLEDCLKRLGDASGAAAVFRPLVVPDLEAARREAPAWRRTLQSLNLPPTDAIFLIEHLIMLLMGRFRQLSREEIEKMLQLTPLRETRAGRDTIEEGIEEGIRIGQVQLLQSVLSLPVSSREELAHLSLEELDRRVADLKQRLQAQQG